MKFSMNKKLLALVALLISLVGEIDARGGIGFGIGFGAGPGWGWGRRGYWGAPGWGWGPGIGFGIGFGGGRRYYREPYYDYYDYDDYYEPDVVYTTPRRKYRTYQSSYENPITFTDEVVTYSNPGNNPGSYSYEPYVSQKQYLDQTGSANWKFYNDTPYTIRIRALRGGGRETIKPGDSKEISRGESFQFLAKSDKGHRQLFEGQDHSISIIEENGQLTAVEKTNGTTLNKESIK